MKFNVVYTNSGPRTPTGGTSGQTVASLNSLSAYLIPVPVASQLAQVGNNDAASVIQSNGDSICNTRLKSNPFPPGLTS
jgi:hypothetical protein